MSAACLTHLCKHVRMLLPKSLRRRQPLDGRGLSRCRICNRHSLGGLIGDQRDRQKCSIRLVGGAEGKLHVNAFYRAVCDREIFSVQVQIGLRRLSIIQFDLVCGNPGQNLLVERNKTNQSQMLTSSNQRIRQRRLIHFVGSSRSVLFQFLRVVDRALSLISMHGVWCFVSHKFQGFKVFTSRGHICYRVTVSFLKNQKPLCCCSIYICYCSGMPSRLKLQVSRSYSTFPTITNLISYL